MFFTPIHRVVTGRATVALNGALPTVVEVAAIPGAILHDANHAWANRSGKPCRMLFVLVDGPYEPAIAAALSQH